MMETPPPLSHLLTEMSSLDELGIPLKKGSARLRYTCICVSLRYICLGSNTGGVYVFSRDSLKHLQVVFGDVETSPVTWVTVSPNDLHLALAVSSGQVVVMELNIERRTRPERLRQTADHLGSTVTSMVWDGSGSSLFVGDNCGKVTLINVPTSKAKTIFTQPSQTIVRLDAGVYQLDWWGGKLLVSTYTRTYLLNTVREQFSQIGKKPRDGEFGSCFFLEPSSKYPVIYCARPGSRMWEVDFEGNVLNTHQFKQLLSTQPLPVISTGVDLEQALMCLPSGAQTVNFKRMFRIGEFILTWSNRGVYIFDPINVKVVLWTDSLLDVKDLCLLKNEIYVLLESQLVRRLIFLPLYQLCSALVSRPRCSLAARLLLFTEHFSLRPSLLKRFKKEKLASLVEFLKAESQLELLEQVQAMLEEVSESSMDSVDSLDEGVEKSLYPPLPSGTSGIVVVNDGSTAVLDFEHSAKSRRALSAPSDLRDASPARNRAGMANMGPEETSAKDMPNTAESSLDQASTLNADSGETKVQLAAEAHSSSRPFVCVPLAADDVLRGVVDATRDCSVFVSDANEQSEVNSRSYFQRDGVQADHPSIPGEMGECRASPVGASSSRNASLAPRTEHVCFTGPDLDAAEFRNRKLVENGTSAEARRSSDTVLVDSVRRDVCLTASASLDHLGQSGAADTASAEVGAPRLGEASLRKTNSMPQLADNGLTATAKAGNVASSSTGQKSASAARKDSSGSDTGLVVRITKKKKRRHLNVVDIPLAGDSSGQLRRSYSTGTLKQKNKRELQHHRSLESSPERVLEDGLYVRTDADPDTISIATISSIEEEENTNENSTPLPSNPASPGYISMEENVAADEDGVFSIRKQSVDMKDDHLSAANKGISPDVGEGLNGVIPLEHGSSEVQEKSPDFIVGSPKTVTRESSTDHLEKENENLVVDELEQMALVADDEMDSTAVEIPAEMELDQSSVAASAKHSENAFLTENSSENFSPSESSLTSSYEHPPPLRDGGQEVIPPLIERLSAMGVSPAPGGAEDGGFAIQDTASMRDRLTDASRRSISSMKDRVTKISSSTRSLIRRVKVKNPLMSRSPSGSPPFSSAMVSGSPSTQAEEETQRDNMSSLPSQREADAESGESPVGTVSIDLSSLLSKTEETQKELSSPSVLLNQTKLKRALNSWAAELNRTLFTLHKEMNLEAEKKRREKVSLEKLARKTDEEDEHETDVGGVVDKVLGSVRVREEADSSSIDSEVGDSGCGDLGSPLDPVDESDADPQDPVSDEIAESELSPSSLADALSGGDMTSHIYAGKSVSQEREERGDSVLCNGHSSLPSNKEDEQREKVQAVTASTNCDVEQSIETDWQHICHVQDPFNLTPQQHMAVSIIATHCLECGCFGNVLTVFSSSFGPKTICTSPEPSSNLSAPFLESGSEGNSMVLLQDGKVVRREVFIPKSDSKVVQTEAAFHNLDSSHLSLQHPSRNSFSSSELVPSRSSYSQNSHEELCTKENDKSMAFHSDSAEASSLSVSHKQYVKGEQAAAGTEGDAVRFPTDHPDRSDDDLDSERAMFVRLFYHFLPHWRIRRVLAETDGSSVFKTWCALITCCQALGSGDIVWMKTEERDVAGSFDYLRSGILPNKSSFLGHISSLFALSPMRTADFAAEVPRQITVRDVLHLCRLHGKSETQVLTRFLTQRLRNAVSHMRTEIVRQLSSTLDSKLAMLECFLSLPSSRLPPSAGRETQPVASADNSKLPPEVVSEAVDTLLSIVKDAEVPDVLTVCRKHSFWRGCLQLLVQTDQWERALQLQVELDDVRLIDGSTGYGFTPRNLKEWKHLFQLYKQSSSSLHHHHNHRQPDSGADSEFTECQRPQRTSLHTSSNEPQTGDFVPSLPHSVETETGNVDKDSLPKSLHTQRAITGDTSNAMDDGHLAPTDSLCASSAGIGCATADNDRQGQQGVRAESRRLSWMGLGLLAAQHLGASTAVQLLTQCCGEGEEEEEEGVAPADVVWGLSDEFYRTCVALSALERQQRLVIHQMLEKVDSYLWAKKPVHLPPQVHYAVSHEKTTLQEGDLESEYYQHLFARLASSQIQEDRQLAEDPDCHWGVKTSIISVCAVCQISLTETVSHLEPGAYVFKCGHAFHKFCAPDKTCPLC